MLRGGGSGGGRIRRELYGGIKKRKCLRTAQGIPQLLQRGTISDIMKYHNNTYILLIEGVKPWLKR